ncbi:unnamed protein product [Lactuca saligna]|uniref:Uncharacterized protein n=1 Tax=Lactuca saligna TaxID=75948 RepID=A0AA35Y482_LACSI|nr:unnamed protein product [Lactuca saligna]
MVLKIHTYKWGNEKKIMWVGLAGDGGEIKQAGVVGARVWSHFQQGGRLKFTRKHRCGQLTQSSTTPSNWLEVDAGGEGNGRRWRFGMKTVLKADEDADTGKISIGKACSSKVDVGKAKVQAKDLVVVM